MTSYFCLDKMKPTNLSEGKTLLVRSGVSDRANTGMPPVRL